MYFKVVLLKRKKKGVNYIKVVWDDETHLSYLNHEGLYH